MPPQEQDWFSSNAPKQENSDWFNSNAPPQPKDEESNFLQPPSGSLSISAHPSGAAPWLADLEADIKNGTGQTFIGRLLQKMGAQGTSVGNTEGEGNYALSFPLGAIRAAKGVAELPSHTWQGTKDVIGGLVDAAQIPSSFAVGSGTSAAAPIAKAAEQSTTEWQRINQALGV